MSEADIRSERVKKLDLLRAAGMDAYPVTVIKDYQLSEVLARFEVLEQDAATITVVGRVMARRGQGGIVFIDLFDGTARLQAVLQKDDVVSTLFELFNDVADIGDFLQVTGTPFTTKRGERSIKVSNWTMAAKSLLPIPDEWFGLKDEEKILRERYLDILLNADVRTMFERKSKFWNSIRQFLIERGFMEVETPILESSPGGADARPFITHHNALDIDVYLRISAGELWQKMLLVAGFPKVFEIGRIFRNEGQSREHAQDYTQLEFYQAFSDYREGMRMIQEMYRHVAMEVYGKYTFEINGHTVDLANEWIVIDYSEIIKENYGIDPINCSEEEAINKAREAGVLGSDEPNKARAIDHLWKSIRKTLSGPAFLIGVPLYLEPLAKRSFENPNIVERFQVILAGSEMGKGFSELNDPIDQRGRFETQQAMRDAGDDEAQRLDEGYIRAMEYGMPPAFGFGVSERLFSFLEDKPISEGQLFPLLRPADSKEDKGTKAADTLSAAIVLNLDSLDQDWKKLNTAAHLAASFAARQGKALLLTDQIQTKDGKSIALNIRHAVMIRTANSNLELTTLMRSAKDSGLTVIPFTQEMIETTDDKKVVSLTKQKNFTEIEFLGILIFGKRKVVDAMTEIFSLHS